MARSKKVVIKGKDLICKHCGENLFTVQNAQVNTTGLTFLNLDWLSESADVFVCQNCGRLEWFMDQSEAKPAKKGLRPSKKLKLVSRAV